MDVELAHLSPLWFVLELFNCSMWLSLMLKVIECAISFSFAENDRPAPVTPAVSRAQAQSSTLSLICSGMALTCELFRWSRNVICLANIGLKRMTERMALL